MLQREISNKRSIRQWLRHKHWPSRTLRNCKPQCPTIEPTSKTFQTGVGNYSGLQDHLLKSKGLRSLFY